MQFFRLPFRAPQNDPPAGPLVAYPPSVGAPRRVSVRRHVENVPVAVLRVAVGQGLGSNRPDKATILRNGDTIC